MSNSWLQIASLCRIILQKLRPFKFLFVVYGLASAVAIWEISHQDDAVDLFLSAKPNFTNTVCELYPFRAEPMYLKAIQAGLCAQSRDPFPTVCRQFNRRRIRQDVEDYFQKGLKTGVKNVERMYYDYVQFLVVSGGTNSEIDAAWEQWRTNFPLSDLPDPREVPP